MKRFLFLVLSTSLVALADTPTPDAQARYIAGMAVDGTPLQALAEGSQAWRDHAREFDKSWAELQKTQLDAIAAWSPNHLAQSNEKDGPLYYMFSGPDFLYAHAFFPRAPIYIMCGTEPVGAIPDVTSLSDSELSHGLNGIHESLNSVLSFSFFITKKMKDDLVQTKLTGTLPLLYVFLARSGCTVREVKLVNLDKDGAFVTDKTATPGVLIDFTGVDGLKQVLYYFTTDLSNSGIKDNPGFMKFCETLGTGTAFAKAASYLMHNDYFSKVRDFLLTHTRSIVQDDSGIPLKYFKGDQWVVTGLGRYAGPIDLFKERYQQDVAELYRAGKSEPLPFHFGYRWHSGESSLLYGLNLQHVPKATRAE